MVRQATVLQISFIFFILFFILARKASNSKVLHYRVTGKGAVVLEMPFWHCFTCLVLISYKLVH